MIPFYVQTHTDVGISKQTNQDSMCVKEAKTDKGHVLLAVLCDGMGGLDKGELASTALIQIFSGWFEEELPLHLAQDNVIEDICYRWERLLKEQNQNIAEYGRQNHIQLGSTVTAMLFLENGQYLIGHVGDSRAYCITNEKARILTQDQTVVANEVRKGRLTEEEAARDPRRNVLLQCIGASKVVEPDFIRGSYVPGECYMLCSDGFRHEISIQEIGEAFRPSGNDDETMMKENLVRMVDLNKERQETDNISAILIKTGR